MGRELSKIVLVEDDRFVRAVLSFELRKFGFEVREAANGQEALTLVHEDCPDYVITDWNMPIMNGKELCEVLRKEQLPHLVHIILMTAHAEVVDLVEALGAGADDYLVKPVKLPELRARLTAGARFLEVERTLRVNATHDTLTHLMNRPAFLESMVREVARSRRYGVPLACVMLDIDHFKSVNDEYGHLAGDAALRQVADVLTAELRLSDFASRFGGKDFCMLMPETNQLGAAIVADRLRVCLADTPVKLDNECSLSVTASFGISEFHADTADAVQMIREADAALRAAKRNGRNQVQNFREDLVADPA